MEFSRAEMTGEERGAVMLEAAIALPVVLLLVFSIISVTQVTLAETAVGDSARSALRSTVFLGTSCEDELRRAFASELEKYGISTGSQDLNLCRLPDGSGFCLQTSVRVHCVLCDLVPGLSQLSEVRRSSRIPFEKPSSCLSVPLCQ